MKESGEDAELLKNNFNVDSLMIDTLFFYSWSTLKHKVP